MKSDSLNFFEKLENKIEENNESAIICFMKFIKEIDGNFSIAFSDLKEQILLISYNCSNIYYKHDIKKKIFTYVTEKKIIKKIIKN